MDEPIVVFIVVQILVRFGLFSFRFVSFHFSWSFSQRHYEVNEANERILRIALILFIFHSE